MNFKDDEHLSFLIKSAPVGIAILDAVNFKVETLNDQFLKIAGKAEEDILGKWYWEPFAEARACYEQAMIGVAKTGEPYYADEVKLMLVRHGREDWIYVNFVYAPVKNQAGEVTKLAVWVLENTQQVKSRQVIEESEERFRSLAEGSEVMISVNDVEGNVMYVNQAWLNLTGKTQQEMQAYGWGEFLHPDDQEQLLTDFRAGIASQEAFTVEFRMLTKQGEPRNIYTKINPRILTDGSYGGTISSSIDITDRVSTDKKFGEANERLNIALDAGKFGITEVDLATGNMVCNERFKNLFGRSKEEKITYPDMFDAMLPKYREDIRRLAKKAQAENSLYEATYEIKWPDGSVHWIEAHGRARYDKNGQADRMVGILVDVTEQITARTQLEQAEANLRLATDAANFGTWHINSETRELVANDRLRELFGFYPGETITIASCIAQITDDYRDVVGDAIEKAITQGGDYDLSYTVNGFHDQRLRWVRAVGNLKVDASGEFTAFTGVIMDVTEQRQIEEQKDDFISIASHELKTPLTSLRANLQLLERMKENLQHPMAPKLIDSANKSMLKINTLIDDLLNINRFSEGRLQLQKTYFKVWQMLNACCSHVRAEQKYELVTQGDQDIEIYADEHRIDQVVVNFVNNAVKYAPLSKTIYLIIEELPSAIKISVRDNGPGIPAEQIPHLFDRYWRADYSGKKYSGLGLGLFICAETIHHHGGEIGADSEVGKGSTFWFTIPKV